MTQRGDAVIKIVISNYKCRACGIMLSFPVQMHPRDRSFTEIVFAHHRNCICTPLYTLTATAKQLQFLSISPLV